MPDRDSTACDAAFLSAAALTLAAVKGGSELFYFFQVACGAALAEMWKEMFDRVATCMKESSIASFGAAFCHG
jgi:carbon monoxide dehydrogenase subunit G